MTPAQRSFFLSLLSTQSNRAPEPGYAFYSDDVVGSPDATAVTCRKTGITLTNLFGQSFLVNTTDLPGHKTLRGSGSRKALVATGLSLDSSHFTGPYTVMFFQRTHLATSGSINHGSLKVPAGTANDMHLFKGTLTSASVAYLNYQRDAGSAQSTPSFAVDASAYDFHTFIWSANTVKFYKNTTQYGTVSTPAVVDPVGHIQWGTTGASGMGDKIMHLVMAMWPTQALTVSEMGIHQARIRAEYGI